MTDDEKNFLVRMRREDKEEIAEVTQLKPTDISDVIAKFEQLKGFHKFLKDRRNRNEPMPESSDDLMMIYKTERPAFMFKRQHSGRRPSNKEMQNMKYQKHSGM